MDAVTIYTLITVTVGGAVDVTEFKTEALCLDGKNLALTGMTVAEEEEQDAARDRRCEEWQTEWRAEHPPREPDSAERLLIDSGVTSFSFFGAELTEDGLIQEWPEPGELLFEPCSNVTMRVVNDGDVKEARCIAGQEVP